MMPTVDGLISPGTVGLGRRGGPTKAIGAVSKETAPELLRPAVPGDVDAMATLINGYAALGLMLPKSPTDLYRLFREFVVVVGPGDEILGCGGLRIYSRGLAEIVGLAVAEVRHGKGTGQRIVERLVDDARALGIDRLFAMTLQEPFFQRLGFERTSLAWIPEKVAADCRSCARRGGCREIAVVRSLVEAQPPPEGRKLRVLGQDC